jgi:hypothetical protein
MTAARVTYLPRRGRNGHSPDCPYAHDRPAGGCGICRSERLAAEDRVGGGPLGSCRSCFAPTPDPEGHCR